MDTSLMPPGFLKHNEWAAILGKLRLSNRQRDLVEAIFAGERDDEIARRLRISPHTVHTHMPRLYAKLHVNDRTGVVIRVFAESVAMTRESENAHAGRVAEYDGCR
jgi:DNA-binding NarL/FixJ family response regulator